MTDWPSPASRRRAPPVRLRADELVVYRPDSSGRLATIVPTTDHVDLLAWVTENRGRLNDDVVQYGSLLLSGFRGVGTCTVAEVAGALGMVVSPYVERAAPRTEVAPHVFTSTEYPADQWIGMHHEMSYSHTWPSTVLFSCLEPATEGGRTPLASERDVYPAIPPDIRQEFEVRRLRYVRNFSKAVDLSWQETFQTDVRAEVEDYCDRWRIDYEWRDHDRLRTTQIRQASAVHARTGERVWFNHAHLFHASSLDTDVAESTGGSIRVHLASDELPRHVTFGDGGAIPTEMLEQVRAAYRRASISFPWQAGDVLIVDNLLTAHGREPFCGERRVVVAMADMRTEEIGR